MDHLARLVRTLHPLLPSQIFWRGVYSAQRRWNRAKGTRGAPWRWTGRDLPRVREDFPAIPVARLAAPSRQTVVALLSRGVFEHLGHRKEIGLQSPDWHLGPRTKNRLWSITLHYHGWAYALATAATDDPRAAELFRHYVGDWMTRCALEIPGSRELAWNSFAIAERLEWWVRSYRVAYDDIFRRADEFEDRFLRSLWQQAGFLEGHLEWDLRANHLMHDLVGLAVAGRFFGEAPAKRWIRRATALLPDQLEEQILTDGGHFERSPQYHADIMNDLAMLFTLVEDPSVKARLRASWKAMAEYLAWLRHPDGDVVQLNDCALRGTEVLRRAFVAGPRDLDVMIDSAIRRGLQHFDQSGVVALHDDIWSLFLDIGPIGAEVQPGHAHADTLTLECSCFGQRLVVDPGTYGYDSDARRAYDRSTRAHNTVCIDHHDSSEVWHIFRVGRRAHPISTELERVDDGFRVAASHDGYDHLPGRPRHRRTIELRQAVARVTIADEVTGDGKHLAQGGLLIHPAWNVCAAGDGWTLSQGKHRIHVVCRGPAELDRLTETCSYHPSHGVEQDAVRIGWRLEGPLPFRVETTLTAK